MNLMTDLEEKLRVAHLSRMTEKELRAAFRVPSSVKVHGAAPEPRPYFYDAEFAAKVEANQAARKAKAAAEKAAA